MGKFFRIKAKLNSRFTEYLIPLAFFAVVIAALGSRYLLWSRVEDQAVPNLEKSIAVLEVANDLHTHHPTIQYLLSLAYQMQGQRSKTIRMLETTMRNYPQLVWPGLWLGDLYKAEGDLNATLAMYQQAIDAAPGNWEGYRRLGQSFEDLGDTEQAITQYGLAAEANPQSAEPHLELAHLHERLGMPEKALDAYQRAMALEPDRVCSYLARTYPQEEKLVEIYEQLLARFPDDAKLRFTLGEMYYSGGLIEKAESMYATALKKYPDPEAFIRLGDMYREGGDLDAAVLQYRQAREVAPWSMKPLGRLLEAQGDIYRKDGQLDRALLTYQAALSLNSGTLLLTDTDHDSYVDEYVAYAFHDHLDSAQQSSNAELFVENTIFIINSDVRRVIFEHPPSQIAFKTQIPPGARFAFAIALAPESWHVSRGDGVQFDIYIDTKDTRWHPFSEYIDPKSIPAHRQFHDREVDLSHWAGRSVTITLATGPGPNGDDRYDWSGWGEPRIVQLVAYNFLTELPTADRGDADQEQVRQETLIIDQERRAILFQHPPTRVTYRVEVPEQARLHFGLGLDPAIWSPAKGDGVEYNIYVQRPAEPLVLHRVFHSYLDPKNDPGDRHWLDQVVNLTSYGGETIDLIFEALPGPAGDADFDWGGWSHPVLVPGLPIMLGADSE